VFLSIKNKTFTDFRKKNTPLLKNYILASLAGIIWFAQFVFKGMGTTKIPPEISHITWSLLFTSVIVFSNIIGLVTKEWKGVSSRTLAVLFAGLSVLIISVILIGIASKY
jgi:L-rhamnose-H+ transport protein